MTSHLFKVLLLQNENFRIHISTFRLPIMKSPDEATVKNHRKSVGSIGRDHIHDPQGIINHSRSKTPINCIHVHYISHLIRPKCWQQLLVVLCTNLPLAVIMLKSTSTSTRNIWNAFRCSMQPLWPFGDGLHNWFLDFWAWNNNTRADWSVPCWIWLKTVITLGWVGISISKLTIATIIRSFLPHSNIILFVVQFEAHWSQQFLQLFIIWFLLFDSSIPASPTVFVVNRRTRQNPEATRTEYTVNF